MRCKRKMKKGWYCVRTQHDSGPCALRPRWWNIAGKLKHRNYLY